MSSVYVLRRVVLVLALAVAGAMAAEPDAGIDPVRLERHVRMLCREPHRLTGTPAAAQAAQYIEQELSALGYDVLRQPFCVPQSISQECRLNLNGRDLELFQMRPNLLQAAVTGAEGLHGRIVYAKSGRLVDFDGIDPKDAIVLLDYSELGGGEQAFALGAQAVVYLDDDRMTQRFSSDKHLSLTANLPRFYMRRDVARAAGLLDDATVEGTIYSSATWVQTEGVNLITAIPGTSQNEDGEQEAIIVSCYYDTLGEVPLLDNGARAAANCAGLLEMARLLKEAQPARTVVLAFFDSRGQFHLGAREFYYAVHKLWHVRENKDPLDTVRATWLKEERESLAGIVDRFRSRTTAQVLAEAENNLAYLGDEGCDELDRTVAWEVDNFIAPITRLNRLIAKAKKEQQDHGALAEELKKFKDLKLSWANVRRAIKHRSLTRESEAVFAQARDKTIQRLDARLTELQQLEAQNAAFIKVGQLLMAPDEKGELTRPKRIVGHFSLQFGDSSKRWGVVIGGNAPLDIYSAGSRRLGSYARPLAAIRSSIAALRLENFHAATVEGLYEPRIWVPVPFTHEGEIAEGYGYYGFCLMTMGDGYPREALPTDVPAGLNLENMLPQFAESARLLKDLASRPQFSTRSLLRNTVCDYVYARPGGNLTGNDVIFAKEGSSVVDRPAAGALVVAMPGLAENYSSQLHIAGYERNALSITDQNGFFALPTVGTCFWGLDAACFDDRGLITYISSQIVDGSRHAYDYLEWMPIKLNLFRCQGGAVTLCRDDITGLPIAEGDWKILGAISDAPPSRAFMRQTDTTVSFYVPYGSGVKLFAKGLVAVLNASPEKPMGTGFEWQTSKNAADDLYASCSPSLAPIRTPIQSALDLTQLNDSRVKILRDAGLINSSVERLHGFAEDQINALQQAQIERQSGYAAACGEAAVLAESRAYQPIMDTMNDVIKAVIFLLALAVPFAFSLERLFIGSPNIYKQIGGFILFFLVTFTVLYCVHPAFSLTATPLMIFLAFSIIVMSGLVIALVMQKFRVEIHRLQGMSSTVHGTDLSRMGTLMAAVQMGISTMRRRPLRTTLTAMTVVLLTFTILCFASFSSNSGVIESYLGRDNNNPGLLVHNTTWSALPGSQVEFIRALLKNEADVFPRVWLSSEPGNSVQVPLLRGDGKSSVVLSALIGVSPLEQRASPALFSFINGDIKRLLQDDGILLSRDIMSSIGVGVGDKVTIAGRSFTVAGKFDEGKIDELRQIDGSPYLPLDYEALKESSSADQNVREEDLFKNIFQSLASSAITPISPTQVALVSEQNLLAIGGKARALVVLPKNPDNTANLANKIALLTDNYVYSGERDGVHKYYFAARVTFTGLGDLIVPLALGGLIVFSTMLGSVVEREKEIYTFSALGLAPPHVASLFFAEVCIYAVLGGLGGYLIGQVTVSTLSFLSTHYGIGRVPDVNYSSMTAVFTILIVMATVMVSTVYPALKASRSANPGVQRSWKIPRPVGDKHEIVFPFTVSLYDMKGIVSFLQEHFENHSDVSLGSFAAQEAEIFEADRKGMLGLRAKVWLAPFDLGVSQSFEMVSRPSEIEGIQEITIRFLRLSGRPANWERFNRNFINDLRKQFLIWRALSVESMENYRNRTEDYLREARTVRPAEGPVLVESSAAGGHKSE